MVNPLRSGHFYLAANPFIVAIEFSPKWSNPAMKNLFIVTLSLRLPTTAAVSEETTIKRFHFITFSRLTFAVRERLYSIAKDIQRRTQEVKNHIQQPPTPDAVSIHSNVGEITVFCQSGCTQLKSSNLDWPELEKHSLSHSFIITLKQSYDIFPNSGLSKLLDFTFFYRQWNGRRQRWGWVTTATQHQFICWGFE